MHRGKKTYKTELKAQHTQNTNKPTRTTREGDDQHHPTSQAVPMVSRRQEITLTSQAAPVMRGVTAQMVPLAHSLVPGDRDILPDLEAQRMVGLAGGGRIKVTAAV